MTDCVLYPSVRSDGYARRYIKRQAVLAHRAAWEEANGPIPAGRELHHRCGVRACVNIEHLQLVTRAEHARIHADAMRTCKYGHEWTPENTLTDSNGWRKCRTCRDEYRRTYHAEHYEPHPKLRKTHCKHGHEFTPENTYTTPKGRHCIACKRERTRQWRERKKAAA